MTDAILQRASDVFASRAELYGKAEDNAAKIAVGWSVIFGCEVTESQVALAMAWLKIARLIDNPKHEDSWVDLAGYAAYGGKVSL